MSGVQGATLVEKSSKVPAILAEKDKLGKDLKSTQREVKDLTNIKNELDSKLKSADEEITKLNKDNLQHRTDLRKVRADLQNAQDALTKADAVRKQLESELIKAKNMQVDTTEIDALKASLTTFKNQYAELEKKFNAASEKARLLDLSEVVVVEDINLETGKKTTTTKYFPPYVVKGQIATVTKLDESHELAMINRGKKDQLGLRQKIDLMRDGKFVANAVVLEVAEELSVISINPRKGIPETIEVGDMLELLPTVDLEKKEEAEAPKADAPAAEAPKAEAPKAEAAEAEEAEE